MIAEIFWTKEKYPGRIALVLRPRGGDWLEDETAAWADGGLDLIISLLDAQENDAFDLGSEAEFCARNGIEFISFPIEDRGIPVFNQKFQQLLEKLKLSLRQGKNIGIHCRQSIGRAPFLAAVLMTMFGTAPTEAFLQLSFVRGVEVPETVEQRKRVEQFAGEITSSAA